jgi:hypothetical protein
MKVNDAAFNNVIQFCDRIGPNCFSASHCDMSTLDFEQQMTKSPSFSEYAVF